MSQRYMPTHMPRCPLPMTPPEVWGPSAYTASGPMYNTGSFYGPIGYPYRSAQESRDNGRRQSQHEEFCEQAQVTAPVRANVHGPGYAYEAQARILPPIRIPDRMQEINQTSHQLQPISQPASQEQNQEERVAGGVSAKLTYKMEQMIDFVAEMAQGIVQPSAQVTPAFRKYVSQILTSTRLPSSTIMLALHYLTTRMALVQSRGQYSINNHLYQMLTTALMLSSKFLDDNTFQNRSWADVSHTPVAELNKNEVEWLADIQWGLHFDAEDTHGFKGWFERWERYAGARNMTLSMEALQLTNVDPVRMTQSAHQRYLPPTPLYTPPYECSFTTGVRDRSQPWQQWGPLRTSVSPSAGPSQPPTPEWYQQGVTGFGQHSATYSNRPLPPLQLLPSPYYDYPSQHYTPSPWSNSHLTGCGCGFCIPPERYVASHNYGMKSGAC